MKAIIRTALSVALAFTLARSARELPRDGSVLSGIDVLVQQGFAPLRGKRIGLVTNQTGVTRSGAPTIDTLAGAPGVRLTALFSPEHGIRGSAEAGARVRSERDERTGLPVFSLYGSTREPTVSMLRGLDALVFDMQDIGSRSYTYISTMGRCMSACAKHDLKFYVLDRPNPIGGDRVEGNILETRFQSFVGPFPIAYCHGLTVGELARMVNERGWLPGRRKCRLEVVPMEGYRRSMSGIETGLPWVRTSPNIPYARSPYFYAATGIVGELPALSIGIGTDRQFELAGAPGLSGVALAEELKRRRLPGFQFVPARWTPVSGVHAHHACAGVRIFLSEPDGFALTRLNFELMGAVRKVAPSIHFFGGSRESDRMFDLDCGTDEVRRMFLQGRTAAEIWARWNAGARRFRLEREPYLLYK